MTFPPLDEAQAIIERGTRAATLLDNETFRAVVDEQTNYHLAALVAARPGPSGAEAVAYHHSIQHALSELISILRGHAEAGRAMQDALMRDEED